MHSAASRESTLAEGRLTTALLEPGFATLKPETKHVESADDEYVANVFVTPAFAIKHVLVSKFHCYAVRCRSAALPEHSPGSHAVNIAAFTSS